VLLPHAVMVSAVKTNVGEAYTVIYVVSFVLPFELLAVRITLYVPAEKYVVDGFFSDELPPLPKSQYQLVGVPVLRSVNCTTTGEHPVVLLAEKAATGACALTLLGIVISRYNTAKASKSLTIILGCIKTIFLYIRSR